MIEKLKLGDLITYAGWMAMNLEFLPRAAGLRFVGGKQVLLVVLHGNLRIVGRDYW
jgi:hypothetical protein